MYDVVIVGGGPAGLSAALILGRCRRRVLLCDAGSPRNARAQALHGFFTRDGTPPLELVRLGREELTPYGIETRSGTVTAVDRGASRFEIVIDERERVPTQAVLLATGICDQLPSIPGIQECYGISVHHCPYCDGWEQRDKPVAVIGRGAGACGLSLSLKTWTARVTLCTNGWAPKRKQREQLAVHGVSIRTAGVQGLEHHDGQVARVRLSAGDPVECNGVFISCPQTQQSDFAKRLGCEFNRHGTVKTDHLGETCVPGVYVVGDASRDVQFAVVAAAEGAKAGVAINKALQKQAGLTVAAEPAHA